MSKEPLLRLRGLSAGYGGLDVVHGVDLEVHGGELVCLVGANGAGKSTLLKAISGLVRPSAGEVRLEGRPLHRLAPAHIVAAGLAHVPERRQIFGELTVGDNLILGAYSVRRSLDRRDLTGRLEEMQELFPVLKAKLQEEASHLSGGQQQILAIARGLMSRPRLLLLDEPSLGLAPVLVEQIFAVLAQLRERGTTLLLVEQNARMSLAIADRGYVMEAGRVVLQGTGAELAGSEEVAARYLGMPADAARGDGDTEELARRLRAFLG